EAADTVPGARALLRREQRLDCVLVASLGHHHARLDDPGPITRARALVQAHGGRAALLAGRWLWVAFDDDAALTARAIRAGVTALALADALPDTPIALSLAPISHGPSTTVIDRVAALLEPGAPTRTTHATHGRVLVDEGARGLLEGRFELEPTEHGVRLVRAVSTEHSVTRARHRVRGRVLPCVGRDKELRQLEATLAGLEDEDPSPSAVVLVAAPGIGKTRLVDEALSRAPVRTRVIVARGDATAPGSALSLLSQWAQTLGGVSPHASAASRRAALQSALARVCSPEDAERISAFLSEASAAPDDRDDDASWAVRAARRDPALFRDQLRRAFTDALLALLAREPVILVVDDLQWADLPSMRLLEHLLARATDRPLAVLGTARLETPAELLGCLGPERVEIRLAPLAPRASARLVDLALDAPAPALREQLVDLGGGNPFYLEELVRAVTDEGVTALPSSVLAAAQGRLTDLGPELRRALRAASVFGLVFEPSAVGALTGEGDPGGALAALEREEIVVRRGDGAFAFRHAITREAAYAMLPDEDRAAAHRAAATWLLERGGADPIALAGHLEHAGEPQRAVEPWLRAARAAVAADDHQAALSLVARALAHARASEAGELELVAAQATLLRGDHAASVGHAERALDTLPAGSASWFLAAETLVGGAIRAGLHEARQRGLDALEIAPLEAAREAFVHACAQVSADHFNTIGDAAVGRSTLERAEACAALVSDPLVLSRLAGARAAAASRAGEHERAIDAWEEALRYNERVGDAYRSLNVRNSVGHGLNELGRFERAVPHLERALADATALGEPLRVWHARTNLGRALGLRGEEARAHELLGRPLELARDNKLHAYFASLYLVELLLAMDRLEEARLAMEEAPRFAGLEGTPLRGFGRALEAELLRRAGSIDEALEQSRLALHEVGDLGSTASGARRAALERVRCLDAAGHVNDATLLARQARDHLRARADRLRDPISRRSFLEAIPEHRALLARAAVDGPDARVLDAAPHGAAQSGVQTEGEPAHAKPGSTRQ
ncbi:MAG: AAA family ATPase, partial [Sandaracinaceae bacterium]|nr:AAA family ATPase [Sandaracinaceae bacterium]